jgi:hypothetical protein
MEEPGVSAPYAGRRGTYLAGTAPCAPCAFCALFGGAAGKDTVSLRSSGATSGEAMNLIIARAKSEAATSATLDVQGDSVAPASLTKAATPQPDGALVHPARAGPWGGAQLCRPFWAYAH